MPLSAPKWTRQPEERPRQIMAAALEVFSERGFERATMDEIAETAGVTKGTIYLYFKSKLDLFIQTLRAHVEGVVELLPAIEIGAGEDVEARVRQLARALLVTLMTPTTAKVFPLFIAEVRQVPELRQAYIEEWLPKAGLRLAALLEEGVRLGVLRPMDSLIAARAIMGMFSSFVLTQEVFGMKDVTPMPLDAIADTIVTIAFRGVLAS